MTEYKPGIYVGPVRKHNGTVEANLMLVSRVAYPIPTLGVGDERLYGAACGMPYSGKWESGIITLESDTLVAPWVLSKWS